MDFDVTHAIGWVVFGILFGAAQYVQTRHLKRAAQHDVAGPMTQKLDTVYRAINGEGIGGKLDALVTGLAQTQKWQADHERQDAERFESLARQIADLKAKP
jgi:hypothetical protein